MKQKRQKIKLINLIFILVLILFSTSCFSNAKSLPNLAKANIKEDTLSNENNEILLTTYAEREIINAEKKLETLKKNNNVSFGFITDIHGGEDLISTHSNINAFRKLGMNSKINFQVCAGDITTGSEFASGKSLYDLEYYTNLLKSTSAPVLFARGNHDCNIRADASVAISGEQYYDLVLKNLKGQCTFNEKDLGGDYYYKDLEQEKIRVCVLNAFNGKNYEFVFGDKQLEFVANNVLNLSNKSNPNEWQVLFITHTVDETSAHNEVPSDNEKLYSIINAFQEGKKVKVSNKEVDYSKQGKGTVIAILTGHHHMDTTTIKNNILIITVRSASLDREGKTTETFDESDLSFDIFTIDKQNKIIYATKVGRGKDRKWKYDINNLKEENTPDEPNNIDIQNKEEPITVKTFVNSKNQVVAVVTSNNELVEKSNKSWKLSKDKKTYVKLLNDVSDGYSTTFTDVKGNKKDYQFNISKLIDTTPPKLNLQYISNEDGTITAEVKSDEILKVKSNKSWVLDKDRRTYKYLFTLNTKNYTTEFTDLFGNSSSLTLNAEIFKPEIKYVKNEAENSIEAIATSPKIKFAKTKPSWKLSDDGHTLTKKYYKKDDYYTTFTDVYGNTVDLHIKIDDLKRDMTIKAENKLNDNGTVTVVVTSNNKFQNIKPSWKLSNNDYTYEKTYSTNEDYSTTFTDIFGNTINQPIKVTVFKPEIKYVKNEAENSVEAIVTSPNMKFAKTKPSWKLSDDGHTLTKKYYKKDDYYTTFTDVYGNTVDLHIEIEDLKRDMTIKAENKLNNNGTVTVVVTSNNKFQNIKPSWKLSNNDYTYEKTYSTNEDYSTTFTDIFGNTINQPIKVTVFKPEIKYVKNEQENSVEAIVTSPNVKFAKTKPSWKLSEDGHTLTKKYYKKENYYTTFTDIFGNRVDLQIKIDEI